MLMKKKSSMRRIPSRIAGALACLSLGILSISATACSSPTATTWTVSDVYTYPQMAMPAGMDGSTIFLISGNHLVGQSACGAFQSTIAVTNAAGKKTSLDNEDATQIEFTRTKAQDANCDAQDLNMHLAMLALLNGSYSVSHKTGNDTSPIVILSRVAEEDDPTSTEGFKLICG